MIQISEALFVELVYKSEMSSEMSVDTSDLFIAANIVVKQNTSDKGFYMTARGLLNSGSSPLPNTSRVKETIAQIAMMLSAGIAVVK